MNFDVFKTKVESKGENPSEVRNTVKRCRTSAEVKPKTKDGILDTRCGVEGQNEAIAVC